MLGLNLGGGQVQSSTKYDGRSTMGRMQEGLFEEGGFNAEELAVLVTKWQL